MIVDIITITRPSKDVPFFASTVDIARVGNMLNAIKTSAYIITRTTSLSEDGLVFSSMNTFQDDAALRAYVAELRSDPDRASYLDESRAYESEKGIIHTCDVRPV